MRLELSPDAAAIQEKIIRNGDVPESRSEIDTLGASLKKGERKGESDNEEGDEDGDTEQLSKRETPTERILRLIEAGKVTVMQVVEGLQALDSEDEKGMVRLHKKIKVPLQSDVLRSVIETSLHGTPNHAAADLYRSINNGDYLPMSGTLSASGKADLLEKHLNPELAALEVEEAAIKNAMEG